MIRWNSLFHGGVSLYHVRGLTSREILPETIATVAHPTRMRRRRRTLLWISVHSLISFVLFWYLRCMLKLITITTSDEQCKYIVQHCAIQVPKTVAPYHHWQKSHWGRCARRRSIFRRRYIHNDCDEVLGFYKVSELTIHDILPDSIIKEILTNSQVDLLLKAFTTLVHKLNQSSIPWAIAWGSALSASRNGVLVAPWDDDIDIMAERKSIEDFVQTLEVLTKGDWCSEESVTLKRCKVWRIENDVIIHWKPTGVPYKITIMGQRYPAIDLNTFLYSFHIDTKQVHVSIPDAELLEGHTRKEYGFARFELPRYLLQHSVNESFAESKVRFSMSRSNFVQVNMPIANDRVLESLYGADVLEYCSTSHIHRPLCTNIKTCLPLDSWVPRYRFPCCKLPSMLRNGTFLMNAC